MRSRVVVRTPAFDLYTVACRFHEREGWVREASRVPELVCPVSGGFLLRLSGTVRICFPARLTLFPAGAEYDIGHLPYFPDVTLVFRLRSLSPRAARRLGDLEGPVHRLVNERTAAAIQLLADVIQRDGSSLERAGEGLATSVAALTSKALAGGGHLGHRDARSTRLERAVHLSVLGRSAPGVAGMAQTASFSASHFARCFHDEFRITPHRVVNGTKLARAWALVRSGSSMTDAARNGGFCNVGHLSSAISKAAGRSMKRLQAERTTTLLRHAAAPLGCADSMAA